MPQFICTVEREDGSKVRRRVTAASADDAADAAFDAEPDAVAVEEVEDAGE